MNAVAVICNVLYWLFFCMVTLADGLPKGASVPLSWVFFLMPIFNVAVIRVLVSPGRAVKLAALAANIAWFGLTCWLVVARYPLHPKEEGLIEYIGIALLTPLLSAAAIYKRGIKS